MGFAMVMLITMASTSEALALPPWPNAPWAIPTNGYVGNFIWGTPTDIGTHTGVDFWTRLDCLGSGGGSQGEVVRATTDGVVESIYNISGVPAIVVVNHQGIWTWYEHLADAYSSTSYIASSIWPGAAVVTGTILGWQGNRTGVLTTCVHLHFTVSISGQSDTWANSVNPSWYLGPDLNQSSPGHVPNDWTTCQAAGYSTSPCYYVTYNGG